MFEGFLALHVFQIDYHVEGGGPRLIFKVPEGGRRPRLIFMAPEGGPR